MEIKNLNELARECFPKKHNFDLIDEEQNKLKEFQTIDL